jgi:hypothetical protein
MSAKFGRVLLRFEQMGLLDDLPRWSLLLNGASIVATAYAIAKAFDWLDDLISDESRVALWYYLADFPSDERIESWASVFPKLIDKVFGRRAISWSFFFRSSIASVLAVSVLFFIIVLPLGLNGPQFLSITGLLIVLIALVSNVTTDYVSLIVSRTFIQLIERFPKLHTILILLTLDFAVTAGLGIFCTTVAINVFYIVLEVMRICYGYSTLGDLPNNLSILLSPSSWNLAHTYHLLFRADTTHDIHFTAVVRVFFLSGFFTSVWLWIYIVSIFAIKAFHRIEPRWLTLLPYLNIEKKPMQAIGRIAGILAAGGYAMILVLVWLSRHQLSP